MSVDIDMYVLLYRRMELSFVTASLQTSNLFEPKQKYMKGSPACVLITRGCGIKQMKEAKVWAIVRG